MRGIPPSNVAVVCRTTFSAGERRGKTRRKSLEYPETEQGRRNNHGVHRAQLRPRVDAECTNEDTNHDPSSHGPPWERGESGRLMDVSLLLDIDVNTLVLVVSHLKLVEIASN